MSSEKNIKEERNKLKLRDGVDILEDRIPLELLSILLTDHTTGKNVMWATEIGGHNETDSIQVDEIVGENGLVLRPRVRKSEEEKKLRTKNRAEVFTPSWVCNEQLNAADCMWFWGESRPGSGSPFNKPHGHTWKSNSLSTIRNSFKKANKDWTQYILEDRIEMCCGEGPYLTSRYDVVSEREIAVKDRIGILDRKLHVVNAFVGIDVTEDKKEWIKWVKRAYQHTYGFEWQGDNLLLTREAMLYTFLDILKEYNLSRALKHQGGLTDSSSEVVMTLDTDGLDLEDYDYVREICEILSWNIWQMDGLTACPPYTQPSIEFIKLVKAINKTKSAGLFGTDAPMDIPDEFCKVMDWDENKQTTYAEIYASAVLDKS